MAAGFVLAVGLLVAGPWAMFFAFDEDEQRMRRQRRNRADLRKALGRAR